ncbi:MAG: hypothetical protein ACR2NP_05925, partial [Pirellulaceae bacterium]
MSDSHPDNHSARHGSELDPRLFEDSGRILNEPASANAAVNEFTVDDVASRSHADPDQMGQGSSFDSLETLDQGVLAQLASHLSMPPAASSGVPDDAGEFTMPATIPAGLPVDAVDFVNCWPTKRLRRCSRFRIPACPRKCLLLRDRRPDLACQRQRGTKNSTCPLFAKIFR